MDQARELTMNVARAVAVAGVLGAGALLLSGCGITLNGHEYQDDAPVPQHFSKVQVNGADDVRIRIGASATVHRKVHYAENDPGKNTWSVRNDTLVLENCNHADCSIDYDLVVPEGTTVTGETGSGDIDVDGVAQINFQTHSGDAVVRNVKGAVNVAANSGEVTVSDIGGAVNVSADSGDVNVSNVTGAVLAKASSGSVQATGIGGKVEVQADSGDVTVGITTMQNVTAHSGSGELNVTVPKGQYHLLTVKLVGHRDATLRFRSGYQYDKEPATLKERFAQTVWQPVDAGEIGVTAKLITDAEGNALRITVAGSDLNLKQQNAVWAGKLDVFLVQRDQEALRAKVSGLTVGLHLKPLTYERAMTQGLTFDQRIQSKQMEGSLRVVVVDVTSGRIGSVTVPSGALVAKR